MKSGCALHLIPVVTPESCLAGCTCVGEHPAPETLQYAGQDAYEVLATDCRAMCLDRPVLVIDDPDTHEVAGAEVCRQLQQQGVNTQLHTLETHPSATEELAETIRKAAVGKPLILAVGAGTVNDLGKYAADRNAVPYWIVPTAPSMNGYTSSIVAIKVRGVKRTLPARPPQRIYVDPRTICNAPLKLRQAGFCDVLAKSVSDIDWQSESLLFNGNYCGLPSRLVAAVESSYAELPEPIGRGDEAAVMGLFSGLMVSGAAMSLAGSSAPASGGEHLVSHFWDMRESLTGRVPELHGLQVGAGILLSAACYSRLARLKASDLPRLAEETFAADVARIPVIWGPYAREVEKQFLNKRSALLQFDQLLPANWDRLQGLFSQVRPPEFFVDLFRRTGIPFTLANLQLTSEDFLLSARNSRTIRERITVLDFAAHAQVLEAATQDALKLLS